MRIVDITKTFDKNKTLALNKINMEVSKNSIHGLLGNNGAGKTTLIKCIVNLLVPDSGKIYYDNINILKNTKTRVDKISVLLDGGRNLYLYMTVKENIKYFSMLHGITDYRNSDKFKMILEYLDIEDILNTRISNLSFGMKQRAALAVALICDFEFIILDEPTTGLDIHYQNELTNLLIKLQKSFNITILVSSHDMDFINKTCDYCTLLSNGNIIKSGKVEEFLNIFESNSYTLVYKNEIDKNNMLLLEHEFNFININNKDKKIDITWEKDTNLSKMMERFDKKNICIIDIIKNNDLTHSILSLTKERR